MKKMYLTAACVASGLALTGTAMASQQSKDGDITVTNEPAGLNCQYGGVAITVQRGKKDAELTLQKKPKQPDPPDEIYYVCNGAPGDDGATGAPGPIGEPGGPGTTPPVARKCTTSVRQYGRVYLPKRLRGNEKLRLQLQGPNTTKMRFNKNVKVRTFADGSNPFVLVPLRNRNCGSYIVTVRSRNNAVAPVSELWTITGLYGLSRVPIK